MKKVQKKDLKILDKIKQKTLKGGRRNSIPGCPPPDTDDGDPVG